MRAVSDKRSEHSHKRERYGGNKKEKFKDKYWIQYNNNKSLTGRQLKSSDNKYRF